MLPRDTLDIQTLAFVPEAWETPIQKIGVLQPARLIRIGMASLEMLWKVGKQLTLADPVVRVGVGQRRRA